MAALNTLLAVCLLCLALHTCNAQKLTGNLTSGITCTPDAAAGGLLGTGCPKNESCCPTTNTCVSIASCGDYVRLCPPPACGKDASFSSVECPTEAAKLFKTAKNLTCSQSRDLLCAGNGTSMSVICTNGAGRAIGTQLLVVFVAALAAVVVGM